jgi:uncharacterized phiE125 gp8 family phage protein
MIIDSKVVESAEIPVTLEEVKAHLKVEDDSEDSLLTIYIKAATRLCESYTGLSFTVQTRQIVLDNFPCNTKNIPIPYGPVTEITTFAYVDADDADQVLAVDTEYTTDNSGTVYTLNAVDSWPDGGTALVIDYEAGFTVTPDELKVAVMNCVGDMYEARQGDGDLLTWKVRALLDAYKVYWNAYL